MTGQAGANSGKRSDGAARQQPEPAAVPPPEVSLADGTPAPTGATLARVFRAAHLLELGVVLIALLYALVFWLQLPARLPSEQDYLALRDFLQANLRPGDGLAVLPFWAERVKTFVHGVPVLALPELDREPDIERTPRLWVVAQPDLPRSDADQTLAKLGARLGSDGRFRAFGPLQLWLFEAKPGRAASYDLIAHAADAQVDAQVPLRLEWHELDFLPRHCLVSRAGQATVRLLAVPMSHGLRLGLSPMGGGEASVQAAVDGKPLPPFAWVAGGPAFQTAELSAGDLSASGTPSAAAAADPTADPAAGAPQTPGFHDVTITVLGRNVCLDAVAF